MSTSQTPELELFLPPSVPYSLARAGKSKVTNSELKSRQETSRRVVHTGLWTATGSAALTVGGAVIGGFTWLVTEGDANLFQTKYFHVMGYAASAGILATSAGVFMHAHNGWRGRHTLAKRGKRIHPAWFVAAGVGAGGFVLLLPATLATAEGTPIFIAMALAEKSMYGAAFMGVAAAQSSTRIKKLGKNAQFRPILSKETQGLALTVHY